MPVTGRGGRTMIGADRHHARAEQAVRADAARKEVPDRAGSWPRVYAVAPSKMQDKFQR
jgi:hypothetical protein